MASGAGGAAGPLGAGVGRLKPPRRKIENARSSIECFLHLKGGGVFGGGAAAERPPEGARGGRPDSRGEYVEHAYGIFFFWGAGAAPGRGEGGRRAETRSLRATGGRERYSAAARGGACLRRSGVGGRSKASAPSPQSVLSRGEGASRSAARRAEEPGERSGALAERSEARPVGRKAVLSGEAAPLPPGGTPVAIRRQGDAVCHSEGSLRVCGP